MASDDIKINVTVDASKSFLLLAEIVADIEELGDLVPSFNRIEAEAIGRRIAEKIAELIVTKDG